MATTNALIKAIGNELINTGGKELVSQGAKQVASSALSRVLPQVATKAVNKAIPVTAQKSILQNIPINTNNQIKLFRGINAETPELLQQYIGDMMDTSIKPRTYGNGGAYGEGYYFTPYKDLAEGYATNDLNKPYQAILEINPNKGRFLGINKANKNRPVDFVTRAEDRGVHGGRSGSVGERDFEKYLNRNGILGNKASDEVYVINDNSALNGMKVVGRRGPDKVWDYSEEVLPEKIKEIGADKYLGEPKINYSLAEEPGIPIYHGTENKFEDFDERLPSAWFSDSNKHLGGETGRAVRAGRESYIVERILPKDLKLATPELEDKLTRQQLIDRGYEGVAYPNEGPNGDETYYEIFRPFYNKRLKKVGKAQNKSLTEIPKIQYSKVDNQISPQQQEFFKDSVVRDDNGNLKALYHGSPNGEFYEFNKELANPESDWGKGFYFTDNELDVKNNYVGGGPDFDNKVARRAEQLEDELDIPYEKAEEQARKELLKGDYQISAYANIEDPAIVGKTFLFDGSEYGVKSLEDYDNIDDYYNDLIYDLSDDVISDTNIDYAYKDDLMRIMSEAYYDGGIGLQELKDKLNELYIEDYDGNLVGNDVARSIIENLGFDGIIDPTVSSKFNMDIADGTTHYIMFNPEQIKNVDNLNPTDNPDIRMSKNGESLTEIGKRLNAMNKSGEMDNSVKRIGSAGVSEIDEDTLPAGYGIVKKYLGKTLDEQTKELESIIGVPLDSYEAAEKLANFVEDEGYDVSKNIVDNLRTARQILTEKTLEELNMEGADKYAQFIQTRSALEKDNPSRGVGPRTFSISADKSLYQTDAAKLDREYSDRLGIGRSHTPMNDKTLSSDAKGYYMGGGIGIDPIHARGETGVSTIAHERMHAWQDINSGSWDSRVGEAIDELREELKKFYHTKEQVKNYRKNNSDIDYYTNDKEQEARMLQSYLDNEGYTNTYHKNDGRGTEWGEEVKPAFDKFFKKLRALSKKGIALPAVAGLVGIGTLAGKKDVDNIE